MTGKRVARFALALLAVVAAAGPASGETLQESRDAPVDSPPPVELLAVMVEVEPELDGRAGDPVWVAAPPVTVRLRGGSGERSLTLRAARTADRIFFLAEWDDATEDRDHRPWVWDRAAGAYREGEAREDVLIFRFQTGCLWVPELDAGLASESDVWLWRAGRTDPVGHADDTWLSLVERPNPPRDPRGSRPLPVASPGPRWRLRVAPDGAIDYALETVEATMFLIHWADVGDRPYRWRGPPARYEGDRVPQFEPTPPTRSAADVRARGRWSDGRWTVEIARALTTGIDSSWQDVDFTWRNGVNLVSVAIHDGREGVYDYADGDAPSTSGLIVLRLGR